MEKIKWKITNKMKTTEYLEIDVDIMFIYFNFSFLVYVYFEIIKCLPSIPS